MILMIYPAYWKMISISNFAGMARDIAIQATVPVAMDYVINKIKLLNPDGVKV